MDMKRNIDRKFLYAAGGVEERARNEREEKSGSAPQGIGTAGDMGSSQDAGIVTKFSGNNAQSARADLKRPAGQFILKTWPQQVEAQTDSAADYHGFRIEDVGDHRQSLTEAPAGIVEDIQGQRIPFAGGTSHGQRSQVAEVKRFKAGAASPSQLFPDRA